MKRIEEIMRASPVMPVLVIESLEDARPVGEALVAGGLRVLEVTLRSDAALGAITEMKKIDGAIVGAGTVTNPDDLDAAVEAGAEFIVSPGLTDSLGRAAVERDIPFLPGIASSGDIMRGLDLGLAHFKFFPASAIGGPKALKAQTGPFHQCLFCPTGGIDQDSASEWLAIEQVLCVGGSWVVPKGPPDREKIEERARAAARLSAS